MVYIDWKNAKKNILYSSSNESRHDYAFLRKINLQEETAPKYLVCLLYAKVWNLVRGNILSRCGAELVDSWSGHCPTAVQEKTPLIKNVHLKTILTGTTRKN